MSPAMDENLSCLRTLRRAVYRVDVDKFLCRDYIEAVRRGVAAGDRDGPQNDAAIGGTERSRDSAIAQQTTS